MFIGDWDSNIYVENLQPELGMSNSKGSLFERCTELAVRFRKVIQLFSSFMIFILTDVWAGERNSLTISA